MSNIEAYLNYLNDADWSDIYVLANEVERMKLMIREALEAIKKNKGSAWVENWDRALKGYNENAE